MIPHHYFQNVKKLSYFFSKISGLFGYSLAQSTESKNFAKIFWFSAFRWNFPVLRNFSHSESNNTSNKYLSPSNRSISLLNRLFIIFVFSSKSFLSNTINQRFTPSTKTQIKNVIYFFHPNIHREENWKTKKLDGKKQKKCYRNFFNFFHIIKIFMLISFGFFELIFIW